MYNSVQSVDTVSQRKVALALNKSRPSCANPKGVEDKNDLSLCFVSGKKKGKRFTQKKKN